MYEAYLFNSSIWLLFRGAGGGLVESGGVGHICIALCNILRDERSLS